MIRAWLSSASNSKKRGSSVRWALGAALAVTAALPAAAQTQMQVADWRAEGPKGLVITYKVAPVARTTFRAAARRTLLPRLEALRAKGSLASYRVLANRYIDAATWDMMVVLDFKNAAELARWRTVEEAAPGGLSPDMLTLLQSAETAPGELLRARTAAPKAGDPKPVYLVIPYDYMVSTDEYLRYVDGYLLPQVDGWLDAGALSSYGVYLPRYAAGRNWASLLVLAYHGDAGLASRDRVTNEVRTRLTKTSPEWKAFSENKTNIRVERQPIVADEILP
jgi:hypothetical protein